MYKVLIIDDELPSREAIRILGEWDRLGVGEIREAADGNAAMELVRSWRPDLALVDMKMPEMDGTEFLKLAEAEAPGMLTIVISGFDDFEYTKQAIQSKVVDYLLKPVIRRELNAALEKAVGYLEERRKEASESIDKEIALNMSLPKLKERIYLSMIERHAQDPSLASSLKLIDADHPDTRHLAAVLRILNLDEIKSGKFRGDVSLLHFALNNVIEEIGTRVMPCSSFANPKEERELIVMFRFKDNGNDSMRRQEAAALLRDACRKLESMFAVSSLAAIGTVAANPRETADSYDKALQRLLSMNLLRLGDPVTAEDAPSARPAEWFALSGRIAMIRGALQDRNPGFVQGMAEDYLGKIRKAGVFTLGDAFRTIGEMEVLLQDLALDMGVPPEELERSGTRSEGISRDFRDFSGFEDLFMRVLDHYCEKIRRYSKEFGSFRIQDIKEYIDQRYAEDINISTFTEKYFLSREYLMKLFKQEYGMGIYEYVLKVRMDKAKELLEAPHLKIQDISDLIGYKDKNYFSKAFKNAFGMSPTEYRHQLEDGK
ncbi:response regulator transcription factor [Cohnella caldifontis]|uniref:response regulator transcription factor n=1 Tax=Cohnella caldifontis TaxID=3027471 RepID=UPI0023EC91AC|nr:response regulator [Cohnella sp. YIM B05605]